MHYNLCRIHQTLRTTPVMAAWHRRSRLGNRGTGGAAGRGRTCGYRARRVEAGEVQDETHGVNIRHHGRMRAMKGRKPDHLGKPVEAWEVVLAVVALAGVVVVGLIDERLVWWWILC